jgi:RHS repeat-associated protein
VLAEESGAQLHWFLTDHQGTVKDVTNNAGTVIDHITYDSFGRIVGQTSSIELRFAYTGREWDGETGQYYYRARYYDATVGRFISEDPLGFDAGDNNLSRYVGSNPVNHIDPNGMYGIIVAQNRDITYVNSTSGSYFTVHNNIQQVINASVADSNLTITRDVTNAAIVYSRTKVGTSTGSNRTRVLGIRYLRGPGADNAGHIIGAQLGGNGTDLNNLFAQRATGYNRHPESAWRYFEDRVTSNIDEELTERQNPNACVPNFRPRTGHRSALMTVRLQYNQGNVRPVAATAAYIEPFLSSSSALPHQVNVPNP